MTNTGSKKKPRRLEQLDCFSVTWACQHDCISMTLPPRWLKSIECTLPPSPEITKLSKSKNIPIKTSSFDPTLHKRGRGIQGQYFLTNGLACSLRRRSASITKGQLIQTWLCNLASGLACLLRRRSARSAKNLAMLQERVAERWRWNAMCMGAVHRGGLMHQLPQRRAGVGAL